jgi:stalled ribosome alternative rescue factor ArfA
LAAESSTNRTLRSIKEKVDERAAALKKELFRQRLELARKGVRAFQEGRLAESMKSFYMYIRILEDAKGVPEYGLTPSLFEIPKDLPELLIISGVYWDMAKILDRMGSEAKQREFHLALEKYIVFTKGLPHQHIAAETLARHIRHGRPKHRGAFLNAYRAIGKSRCFIATSLLDRIDLRTLPTLRRYRDEELLRHKRGRAFVRVYYLLAPAVAWVLERAPEVLRGIVASWVDALARRVDGRPTARDSAEQIADPSRTKQELVVG